MGMMVLPVDGTNNKGKKGGKKGQAKKGQQPGQDVQVNLIVDPTAFQPPDESDGESEDEYRTQDGSAIGARKRRARRRRGLFEGLAMEEDWKRARSWAKKLAVIDVLGALIWAVVFVYLMIGQRCPAGAFGGWYVNILLIPFWLLTFNVGVTRTTSLPRVHACSVLHLHVVSSLTSRICMQVSSLREQGHEINALSCCTILYLSHLL